MSKGKRILVAGLFSNLTTSSYLDNDYRASVIGVNPDHIVEYRKSRRSTLKMDIVEEPGMKSQFKGIFSANGALTEQAMIACREAQIDPRELVPQPVEQFIAQGLTEENARKVYSANKRKRKGLLNVISKTV